MSETKSSRWATEGPFVGALLILLCVSAAYLVTLNQRMKSLVSTDAKLLFHGEVIATLSGTLPENPAPGMPATVLISGYGKHPFAGIVKLVHVEPHQVTAMIQLDAPPDDVDPPVPCQVAIDPTTTPSVSRNN